MHVGGAATRSCTTKVDGIGESAITASVRLAARTGDGPEPMGPYPILTAMINRLSVSGPIASFRCRAISGSLLCESRHRAAHGTRSIGGNCPEGDMVRYQQAIKAHTQESWISPLSAHSRYLALIMTRRDCITGLNLQTPACRAQACLS